MYPAADGFNFVSEVHWNSAYYGTMAVASSTVEAVQKKATEIALPLRLWNFAWKMRDLAELIENIENPKKARAKSVPSSEQVDPRKVVEQMDSLLYTLDNFLQQCRRTGYFNRTLTATQLNSIGRHTETLREFDERVKLILDPGTDEIFRRARENREAHGTVSMSSVF
jgi:hypothetical protein